METKIVNTGCFLLLNLLHCLDSERYYHALKKNKGEKKKRKRTLTLVKFKTKFK